MSKLKNIVNIRFSEEDLKDLLARSGLKERPKNLSKLIRDTISANIKREKEDFELRKARGMIDPNCANRK